VSSWIEVTGRRQAVADVATHPHIGLATVTYLFDGAMVHRDSTGVTQRIEPGAVNWMTAGSGVVHSERSPDDARAASGLLAGLQTWVALPEEAEETCPRRACRAGDRR
jgi:redox-sensitive bicupin YhaK (pirin superfamily)